MDRPKFARMVRSAGVAVAVAVVGLGGGAGVGSLEGQSLGYAEVRGSVVDPDGRGVAGALVSLRDSAGAIVAQLRSLRDGGYRLAHLEPGAYQLLVEQLGRRPVLVRGLHLERGSRLDLPVMLDGPPAADPAPGAGGPAGADGERLLDRMALDLLPFPERQTADLHREHTRAATRSFEGLPLSMLQLRLSGSGIPLALATGAADRPFVNLPLYGLHDAAWRSLPDVEFDAPTGAALEVGLPSGAGRGGRLAARAGASGLLEPDYGDAPVDAFFAGSYDARFGREAGFFGGVEWRRSTPPRLASPELVALSTAAADAAADVHGVELEPIGSAPASDVLSVFARLDLPVDTDGYLRVQGVASGHSIDAQSWLAEGRPRGSRSGAVALDYSTPVSRQTLSDTRVIAAYQEMESGETLPLTRIGPLQVGTGPRGEKRVSIYGAQTFHTRRGAHALKGGASLEGLWIDGEVSPVAEPAYRFADGAAFAATTGFYAAATGGARRASAFIPRVAFHAQDTWRVAPALRLLVGARAVLDLFPTDDLDLEERWYFATGMASTDVPGALLQLEPRLGVTWEPDGRHTRAYASVGLFHDRPDPRAVVELIGSDGSLPVRRVHGSLRWPQPPAPVATDRSALTVPGSTFRGPRSLRAQGGVLRESDDGRLGVEIVARRTDRLLTRDNGNRRTMPWGRDEHGRALWAPPVEAGGLLGAGIGWSVVPDFDQVWILDANASSTYYAATLHGSLRRIGGLVVNGSYTLSRTRDDWPGSATGPGATPPPGLGTRALDAAWMEGVSDFDIPHQGLLDALVALPLPASPTATLRYRVRSGLPFTPGYSHGMDYNADGLANDPAHVDPRLAGMDDLLEKWSCLRENAGHVAPRNSCRSDPLHSIDAALHLELLGGRAAILLEALGLLTSRGGTMDASLYRLDPDRQVEAVSSIVAIPLVVNPTFGSVLVDRQSIATLRVGLKVTL